MKRICKFCGNEYEGRSGSSSCPSCVDKNKRNKIRPRKCTECGASFNGGPAARYCSECRKKRTAAHLERYVTEGARRPIGSVSRCILCGEEYIVAGGRQKYCKKCAEAAHNDNALANSNRYYQEHRDLEKQRETSLAAIAPVACEYCGKLFIPRRGRKTCSPECRKRRHSKITYYSALKKGMGIMKNIDLYSVLLSEAANYSDRNEYISDMALSSIWGDAEGSDIPQERIERLGSIWDVYNRNVKDICEASGMKQRELARRFQVPYRTMEDWYYGKTKCPLYTRLMIQECLGLYHPEKGE